MSDALPNVEKTSWPIKLYLPAAFFAFVTVVLFTPTLSGGAIDDGRILAQAAICLLFVLRLLWAVHKKERNKIWLLYVVAMFAAAPIWLLAEPWLLNMLRRLH